MSRLRSLTLPCVGVLLLAANARAENWAQSWTDFEQRRWHGNVNFLLGSKDVNNSDWDSVDEQTWVGVAIDFRRASWPVNVAFAVSYGWAADDVVAAVEGGSAVSMKVKTKSLEVDAGLVKVWDEVPLVRPYLGAGVVFIQAEKERSDIEGTEGAVTDFTAGSDSARGIGPWVTGGVYWTPGEHVNVGLQLKWTKASADLFEQTVEVGGTYLGVLAGYHF